MASKYDIVQGLERRFQCHVEVQMESPPNMIYFLNGDTHWLADMDTGLVSKPLPSGRVIVGHPEALNQLYERMDVAWPGVVEVVAPKIIQGAGKTEEKTAWGFPYHEEIMYLVKDGQIVGEMPRDKKMIQDWEKLKADSSGLV